MNKIDKPCPFCGGTNIRVVTMTSENWSEDHYCAVCVNCGASSSVTKAYLSYDDAIDGWNKRYKKHWFSDTVFNDAGFFAVVIVIFVILAMFFVAGNSF